MNTYNNHDRPWNHRTMKLVSAMACLTLALATNASGQTYFLDSFDDGSTIDGSPVDWNFNFGGGGEVDDQGYTFAPTWPRCCLGAVVADETYADATVRTRIGPGDYFLAGITARGPLGGAGLDWYFAGARRDRIVALFTGGRRVASIDLPPEFDFARDDLNLQLDMNGNVLSLRTWLNDDPIPSEPQISYETSPNDNFFSSEGQLGFWHNSGGSADPPMPTSFRFFEVAEYVDQIYVGGDRSIGVSVFDARQNLALGGTATASSVFSSWDASRAIDGNKLNTFQNHRDEPPHWWQVELEKDHALKRVELTSVRRNGDRLVDGGGFQLTVLDSVGNAVFRKNFVDSEYTAPFVVDLTEDGPVQGRTIRLEKLEPVLPANGGVFSLREVEVFSENFIARDNTLFTFELDLDNDQHDVLTVPGTLELQNSRIAMALLSGIPQLGDRFQLIEADAILGEFGHLDLPVLDEGLAWNTSDLAVTGTLSVMNVNCDPNTNGDIDGDGIVEFADFLILSSNFGSAVANQSEGDIDCSGTVDFTDFLVLSSDFGSSVSADTSPVPEPSGLILAALAALTVGIHRRRKSSSP